MAGENLKLRSGTEIPVIGFGTWQLSPKQAYQSVKDALEIGYRHIDTAKIYGNEQDVGRAVKDSGIKREDIFITTKLWNSDQGYDSALKAFDESLGRLGLDYIDLYLIHWPGQGRQKRHDSWKALLNIKASGRVRSVGVSNFTIEHLQTLFQEFDEKPAVNQVEFHPFIYEEQAELLDFCKSQNIVFEAYSPLARGKLNDPMLGEIGGQYGKSAAQVMLRWALQHGTVPLPRSSSRGHIEDNFDVFDFELSGEDMKAIDNITQAGRTAWDPTNLQ
jgi:diketogulonate reductase-like aldo/keto reductase